MSGIQYHLAMTRLDVRSSHGDYLVFVGAGLLHRLDSVLREVGMPAPSSVVTDRNVGPLHGRRFATTLGLEAIELAPGERHKRWSAVERLCDRWLDERLNRSHSVIAVGGGVVTDTVGFAAAVFLRGIAWIAVPTTLLGMVDAAIGGKTGVNLTRGKNLVGTFWPPRLVVADVDTLKTLPDRELRAGLAEVVKAAWVGDHDLLELVPSADQLERGGVTDSQWHDLVTRAMAVKIGIVADDEHESGRRKALNLGHTLGHALEAATGYQRFLHGEAVAWGLEAAAILGRRHGLLDRDAEAALRAAVARLGDRPPIADLDAREVSGFIAVDKKRDAGGVGWVLPTDDGVALDQRVQISEAIEVLRELQNSPM
jgi:3-dehydroquinate synthase